MSNFWMVEESLLKGMGGSLTCRRRSRAEPLEEPEPAASGDSSPVSESFHSETSSTHLLVETTVVAAEPPSATSPSEETIFRVSNAVGSLEAPTGVNWSDPKVDFRIYAVWIVPRAAEPRGWAGLHWGCGTVVYSALINLNRGEFSGLRWRRFNNFDTALAGFRQEALGHQVVSHPVKIFRWRWNRGN